MEQDNGSDWLTRNWKWLVPVGCLGLFLLFAAFVIGIFSFVMGLMKSSDAYKEALTRAQNHPFVQEIIGDPIEAGWFTTGSINIRNQSGHADLVIPISGPNGKAKIYVVAIKSEGVWSFSTLMVESGDDEQRLNLLTQ